MARNFHEYETGGGRVLRNLGFAIAGTGAATAIVFGGVAAAADLYVGVGCRLATNVGYCPALPIDQKTIEQVGGGILAAVIFGGALTFASTGVERHQRVRSEISELDSLDAQVAIWRSDLDLPPFESGEI